MSCHVTSGCAPSEEGGERGGQEVEEVEEEGEQEEEEDGCPGRMHSREFGSQSVGNILHAEL